MSVAMTWNFKLELPALRTRTFIWFLHSKARQATGSAKDEMARFYFNFVTIAST